MKNYLTLNFSKKRRRLADKLLSQQVNWLKVFLIDSCKIIQNAVL